MSTFRLGVCLLAFLLLGACAGPSEPEVQRRIDEAVADALAEQASSVTTMVSITSSTSAVTTTTVAATTTSTVSSTTTVDLLDPDVVRSRFIDKANREVAKVAERLPVEGITPDHFAEYQPPYTFDIETTDSIISPYDGTLVIPMLWYYQGEATGLLYLVARYQYTDFEWRFASAVRYLDENTPDTSPTITQWAESLFR